MTSDPLGFPLYTRENYPPQGQLLGGFLSGLWATAAGALGFPAELSARSTRLVRDALPRWSAEPIGAAPARPSYVSGDGFPAEMSVNWSGSVPELRVLFDRSDSGPGDESAFPRGPERTREPAARRRARVDEVFTPRAGRPSAAPVWDSVAWRPPAGFVHKTYFGLYEWPEPGERRAAVDEAMHRLGLSAAWDHARSRIEAAGGDREIEFFAVDLAGAADARVKVYYRNHGADLAELDRIASVARQHDSAAASTAYRMLTGGRADAGEAALSCLAFRSGLDRAAEATTYLRLPGLAPHDQVAVDRTAALLRHEGVDPRRFRELAAALAPGPLADGTGLLELVSYRAAGRRGDVTTYFRFPVYPHRSVPRC
ncbi:hypothetical protein [Amycolatopsis sp. PS_44_ISF1]|uniref:hypothetical protein n=1 Tax=Amycolatopsis sp. PS_44_ISF1 TaxID=2974917 RepID=UPI0028DDA320|nr:hypothetical protein [Amycolatopsis sp. PS_44_ISF1]MDT8913259.1 hypothetical protein [Amycolatopsis sp. PS_44_ISF1]